MGLHLQCCLGLGGKTTIQTNPSSIPNEKVVKPQWKAAVDFKWIWDNRATVAQEVERLQEGKNLKEGLITLEEDLLILANELQQEALLDCSVGSPREFGFPIKDHFQLGRDLDLIDFDAASEVSGSKFYYLKNEAILLEMAFINWTISQVMRRGFTPLATSEIMRSSVVEKCAFQPHVENMQVYSIEGSDQCLIGTAEIPVGGIHMDSILAKSSLPLKKEGKNLKEGLITLEEDLLILIDELQQEAQRIPNMTHPDVPVGGEDCSVLTKMVGSPREFGFPIKDHFQLERDLDLIDFDAASEVSGSKFYYLKNEAVLLEMAFINWTISQVMRRGFTPLTTSEIMRSSVVEKCAFHPRVENMQVYSIEGSDQCLIGTAEIPVGGIHMDSILAESSLPLKYVAFSHCFRTDAGAATRNSSWRIYDLPCGVFWSRGLYRVHQFSKLEMFILCRPEESDSYHEELIGIEEGLFSSLGFHFKTLDMASEDLGAPAYRKFDVEAWMPGLGRFGEYQVHQIVLTIKVIGWEFGTILKHHQ
ncbi:unnamed protein product [Camellia sinensis]